MRKPGPAAQSFLSASQARQPASLGDRLLRSSTARDATAHHNYPKRKAMSDPTERFSASTAGPQLSGRGVRASDADRYATVEVLQDAIARGLLTLGEGSERMSTAFATVYVKDLEPITADLPKRPSENKVLGWRAVLLLVFEQLQTTFRTSMTGWRRPATLAAALLLFLLFIAFGMAFAHLMTDNGGGPGYGPGGPGYGPGYGHGSFHRP